MPRKNDLPTAPGPRKGKSLREQLQELANANTVKVAAAGFAEIDRHAERAKAAAKKNGIVGVEDFIDGLSNTVKKQCAKLLTGRDQ